MYLVGGSTLLPFQVSFFGVKNLLYPFSLCKLFDSFTDSCLQITEFLPGAGEVLMAHSLLTGTPLVDNWFVSSSLLSLKL